MKIFFTILLFAFFLAPADPLVNFSGYGTRALGLANNFTAISNDFSAVYWNPAGLAFVTAREVHCGVDFNQLNTTTGLGGTLTNGFNSRFRLTSAGLMQSIPTVRGGCGFAVGYSSPYFLDDINNISGFDLYRGTAGALHPGDMLQRDYSNHSSTGECSEWIAAVGWQIAPDLGFGFSIGLLTGSENRTVDRKAHTPDWSYIEDSYLNVDRAYIGYDARIGLLYKPTGTLSLGCRFAAPILAKTGANELYLDYANPDASYENSYFGVLQSAFSGALGAALQLPVITVTSDVAFRSPIQNAPAGSDQSRWKGGVGMGIEIPVSFLASVIRGGYAWNRLDLSPLQIRWDGSGVDPADRYSTIHNTHLITVGYSLFPGSSVSFDCAWGFLSYAFSNIDPDWADPVTEKHYLQRGMLTLSIRY